MVATYLDAVRPARPLADGEAQTHERGIAFVADRWTALRRFLILGTQGGNFYTPEADLTIANVGSVRGCLAEDWSRAIAEIVQVSEEGRAPKNEPAILALAMATMHDTPEQACRRCAYAALPRVCRTGTHLLHFAAYREGLGGGWGGGMRRAVGRWFADKGPRDLAYQAVKYPRRDGWSLADLLRLAHPTLDPIHSAIAKLIVDDEMTEALTDDPETFVFLAASAVARSERLEPTEIARLVREQRLPRETINTTYLNDPAVWDALLADMPMTAMLRNLGKMSAGGLLVPGSDAERTVVTRLADEERLRRARVHPIAILAALKVYEQGHGERGKLAWTPSKAVINALDAAFYLAFGAVEPTGKRMRLALDVSGSMDGSRVNGMPFLSAREASAALALVTLATEPNAHVVAYSHELVDVALRPSMRLDEVVRTLEAIPMGGTFCTLPIMAATQSGAEVDLFASYTDSETWNGGVRRNAPVLDMTADEALREYRLRSGIEARHVVVAMTANRFTIADPRDPGQLDIAGLDAATPQIISDFALGRV